MLRKEDFGWIAFVGVLSSTSGELRALLNGMQEVSDPVATKYVEKINVSVNLMQCYVAAELEENTTA